MTALDWVICAFVSLCLTLPVTLFVFGVITPCH